MKRLDAHLLQTATNRLVEEFQPDQIWLFGSHAWDETHDNSDVDLLVVVSESNETPIRRSQWAYRCLRRPRKPKDDHVETRQEINRVKGNTPSLENTIFTQGCRLYG